MKLIEAIKEAQGDRSQNQFAADTGVSSAAITKILKGNRNPTPALLLKLSIGAQNGITYETLMEAAGYINADDMETKNMPDVKEIKMAQRFMQTRLEKGISREKVASELGVSVSMVERWEQGLRVSNMKASYIFEMANLYGVSYQYLANMTDDPISYYSSSEEHFQTFKKALAEIAKYLSTENQRKLMEYANLLKNDQEYKDLQALDIKK